MIRNDMGRVAPLARWDLWPALLLLLVLTLAGCRNEAPAASRQRSDGKLTIFAASSLTDVLADMANGFRQSNPSVGFVFNFNGSQQLRFQIDQGARADIFVSADERQMRLAEQGQLIEDALAAFASNSLTLVLPRDNPAQIADWADLAHPGVRLDLAGPEVPAGIYAREALARMSADPSFGADFAKRVLANVVSNEDNVRQALTKVLLGEADAAIVYATDVTPPTRDRLVALPIAPAFNPPILYYMAAIKGGKIELAGQFINYVLSADGQRILRSHGFGAP